MYVKCIILLNKILLNFTIAGSCDDSHILNVC